MANNNVGLSFGLVGPPKSGKSTACLSLDALPGKKYAFVAPLGELHTYAGSNIEAEAYYDEGWHPSENSFKSTGYARMMAKLKELEQEPALSAVIFDTFNRGPSELIWHYVMMGYSTDDPRTLGGNSRQPYVTYASRMTELLERLDILRYKSGAHLVLTFHEDVRETPGVGVPRQENEGGKMVTHWGIARVPMIRGAMREDIMGWPDASLHCEPVVQSNPYKCRFVVFPDATRTAVGVRGKLMAALQKQQERGPIENNVLKLIELGKSLDVAK